MQFLMVPILLGLGTVAIPVVIHLLHRQKTTLIAWGAMRFLIPSRLQAKRRKKVEHWLLMLLRMAGLACLVFLLARPIWKSDSSESPGGRVPTDVVIILDHSLSTGRRAADSSDAAHPQTVFDRAVAAAGEVAGQLQPADTFGVILAGHAAKSLTDRPVSRGSSELRKLRETLWQLKPGLGDADLPAAVRAARELVSHGRNRAKRILILGDEQRVGWEVENAAEWKTAVGDGTGGIDQSVGVFDVPVAVDAGVSDVAVARVEVRPGVIGVGRPVEILASITHAGGTGLTHVPVKLVVDGKIADSQEIDELPGNTSRTVRFEQKFDRAGSHWAKVSVESIDGLEADNTATLALNVLTRLPVLVIDGQLTTAGGFRGSQFLAAALEPADAKEGLPSLIQAKVVGAPDAPNARFEDYAAVVVNDVQSLPTETWFRLAAYARGGGGVWVVLGPRTDPSNTARSLAEADLFEMTVTGPKRAGGNEGIPPPELLLTDPVNPMIARLTGGDRNGLAGTVTTVWWVISPTAADERVVLLTSTGEPIVLERPIGNRGGRVVLWASSVDGVWSNLPLARNFVPLVQETIFYLSGGSAGGGSGSTEAGKPLLWTGTSTPPVIAATVIRPDGAPGGPVRVSSNEGKSVARYDDTRVPGLYELRFTPSGVPQPVYFGVGIDPRELDQAILAEADVKRLHDAGFLQGRVPVDKIGTITGAGDRTTEMWPLLAVAVLGILVLETFMTYRMVRLQASNPTA